MEAFPGRLVSEVLAEVDRLPVGLLDDVLEAKAYRQAKQARESAELSGPEAVKHLPKGGLFDLVPLIDYTLAQEAMKKGGGT